QTEIRSFHLFEVKILRIFPFYVPGHGSYPIYRRFCPLCNAKRLDVRQVRLTGQRTTILHLIATTPFLFYFKS
ncbi:MAG: hypothetical protein IJS78_03845, partial [Clostridia bacterium]|nr:hypothetical protein [Clostridia bacterium]